jgi:hypothetical protein
MLHLTITCLHSCACHLQCRCGHCKSLEPVIRSLAKLLHQRKRKNDQASAIPSLAGLPVSGDIVATKVDAGARDDVIVAQIDGSANDLHSLGAVDVNGFPTIVFVRYVDGNNVMLFVILLLLVLFYFLLSLLYHCCS